jgi:hypothetical protein
MLMLAVSRLTGQGSGGRFMLIACGAFGALIWGVVGWAVSAIVDW